MAKGSVRKKGKKWYYRFYVEDASGNLVQKEFAGTENKSETEKLLRQAMEDYEAKRFVAKAENITLGELLDLWAEEELKTGTLSNGTVGNFWNLAIRSDAGYNKNDLHQESILYIDDAEYREKLRKEISKNKFLTATEKDNKLIVVYK